MKIAIVSLMGGLPWGGSESLWYAVAKHALKKGDGLFVSVYNWGTPHEKLQSLQNDGAIVHYRQRYDAAAGSFEKIKRFIKSRRPALNTDYQSIIDFKPDSVLISQGDSFDLAIHHRALYSLLKQNNILYSLICHSHEQYSLIPPKEIYPGAVEIFNNAKQVFFVSHRQWQLTERRLATKIANGKFTWNPLNMQLPESPLPLPAGDPMQMALVGNISGNKGHDTALEVLGMPQWKERNWVLNIYGDGEGRKYVEDLAVFYDITNRIIFHGHVADMIKVWQQNHLLLIPSAAEGLPISLAEAMACGRAAVVTDVGGNIELITEGVTGYIAASPTTGSFEAALERAWLNKDLWTQLGLQAFEDIHQRLDKDPALPIYQLLRNGK